MRRANETAIFSNYSFFYFFKFYVRLTIHPHIYFSIFQYQRIIFDTDMKQQQQKLPSKCKPFMKRLQKKTKIQINICVSNANWDIWYRQGHTMHFILKKNRFFFFCISSWPKTETNAIADFRSITLFFMFHLIILFI